MDRAHEPGQVVIDEEAGNEAKTVLPVCQPEPGQGDSRCARETPKQVQTPDAAASLVKGPEQQDGACAEDQRYRPLGQYRQSQKEVGRHDLPLPSALLLRTHGEERQRRGTRGGEGHVGRSPARKNDKAD
jgi:hypothetical protein